VFSGQHEIGFPNRRSVEHEENGDIYKEKTQWSTSMWEKAVVGSRRS